MKATIHQPDFLPWFGFFNKVAKADLWIVLDHVENNPRDAAFWGRRVRVLVNGQPTWLSIPLSRPAETRRIGVPICQMSINMSSSKVFEKCLQTVRMAYARAPFFRDHIDLVEAYFRDGDPSLLQRNMRFIRCVMDILGIETRILFSSSFGVLGNGTQLLVDLLIATGADSYLCGTGADGYQQEQLFTEHGISLHYNQFEHPTYRQLRAEQFVPGLSILDALFCVPQEQLASWVKTA